MLSIRPVIIVEGRDDEANIKRVVDAEVIITHGYGLSKRTLARAQFAAETVGVIIFTDPDFMGQQIRSRLSKRLTGDVRHAYISRAEGTKGDNIGVENAAGAAIVAAVLAAKPEIISDEPLYTANDMRRLGLVGQPNSKQRRVVVGSHFRIGYANGKQLLSRLNAYQIDREALEQLLADCEDASSST